MFRVMFIHRDLRASGGVPNCILNFARHRNADRAAVRVGCFQRPSASMVRSMEGLGILPVHLGDFGYVLPAMRLRAYLKAERIDVLVCCSFKSYLVGKIATAGTGCRLAFWVHSIPLVIHGNLRRSLVNWLVRRDTMVFVSHAAGKVHRPVNHQGPSAVVYNGVADWQDLPRFTPYPRSERSELGIPSDAFVLCYIAEMIGWKDHLTLLDAFQRVVKERSDAHLLLVGVGELSDRLKRAAQELDCCDRIHFLGLRSDARRLLGLADVYVHPSRGEAFGLAVVEAMLAERPVVAARDGAMTEYLREADTGMLFEPGDPLDLAEKVLAVAADPGSARQMGERARQLSLNKFAPERFAEALCDILEHGVATTDDLFEEMAERAG